MSQAWLLALLFISSLVTSTSARSTSHVAPAPYRERALFGAPKIKVEIRNTLPEMQEVKLHCQSADDDLGVHILPFNGTFAWRFRVNFWVTTLFDCQFIWRGASATYDIYRAKRDSNWRCPTYCYWEVHDDGVYGYTELEHANDIVFPWPNPQNSNDSKKRI